MAISYVGIASNPTTTNGSNSTSPTAITPPSMQSGDLVVVLCSNRLTADTHAVSQAGGQTWTQLATTSQALCTTTWFYCIFNGSWSADPSFSHGGTNNTCMMMVFRPTSGKSWQVDVAENPQVVGAPSTPFDVTITGITTAASSVAIAGWASRDDNTWAYQSGTSWTEPAGATINNLAGSDSGVLMAYRLMSSGGGTGSPVGRETTVGGDACNTNILSFKEVTPNFVLVVADTFHGLTSTSPTLTQKHRLTMSNAFHGLTSTSPALTQKSTIAINNAFHGLISDNVDLVYSQTINLVVSNTFHGHTAGSVSLAQKYVLVVSNAFHGLISGSPALTQKYLLVVSNAFHGLTSSSPLLTQKYTLAVNSTVHGLTSSSPALTQKHRLTVSNAFHGLISDVLSLVQKVLLVVDNDFHGLISDNITLEVSEGSITLVVSNCSHALSSGSPSLTQEHVLAASNSFHSLISESPDLILDFLLIVNNALHGHTADNVVLEVSTSKRLEVQDAIHQLTSDLITLLYEAYVPPPLSRPDHVAHPIEIWTETGVGRRMIRVKPIVPQSSSLGGSGGGGISTGSRSVRRVRGDL